MIDKLGEILKFRVKAILVGMFALGVGLICYKFMGAYFDRNQMMWETKLQGDVAEIYVLADQQIDKARMAMDWDCGTFSLSGKVDSSENCNAAKNQYKDAVKYKAEVVAKKSTVLSQAGKTKEYYDGVLASSKQKPLPFYFFVGMALIILAGILYFLLPNIQAALNKEARCSDDGLQ